MSANARFYPLHPMNTHPDDELDMPSDVRRQWRPNIFRRVASPVILTVFMVSLLWMGLSYDYSFDASAAGKGGAFADGLSQSDGAIDISGLHIYTARAARPHTDSNYRKEARLRTIRPAPHYHRRGH